MEVSESDPPLLKALHRGDAPCHVSVVLGWAPADPKVLVPLHSAQMRQGKGSEDLAHLCG